LIKNSKPFGKKCQKTTGGIFLTHTVHNVMDDDDATDVISATLVRSANNTSGVRCPVGRLRRNHAKTRS